MSWLWTILGILFWMLVGAIIAVTCEALRGRRIIKSADPIAFGLWLGKTCKVRYSDGKWRRCNVVAVSHKGAVAVRNAAEKGGKKAFWIPKEEVLERVRWEA